MSDLYYLNARLRAMRGQLLGRQDYEQILTLPDLPAMMAYLLDSPYGRSIESVGEATSDVARVEEGLRRNFSETLTKLFAISTGEPQEGVRLLLGYWDVYNIRTILRGKNIRLPAEEILPTLIPTGALDEAALEELCKQPDLRAVVDLLVTWRDPYGRPLVLALKDYHEPKDLLFLELVLDRFYFEQAFEKLEQARLARSDRDTLRMILSLLVDRTNLMTALKVVEEQITLMDKERYFLSGGHVYTEQHFARLLTARSLREAFEEARLSHFKPALKDLGESTSISLRGERSRTTSGLSLLSMVERQLDRLLLRKMRALMRTDPVSMAAVVGYLLDKIREITNLRMILRGRLVNLPEPELLRFLILEY